MSKTRLSRMEDFVKHLKDNRVVLAYFMVDTQQKPLAAPSTGEDGKPVPVPVQITSAMIFTAKTPDDKALFTFGQIIAVSKVSNEAEYEAYEKEVQKARGDLITIFQDKYSACHLFEGVVE